MTDKMLAVFRNGSRGLASASSVDCRWIAAVSILLIFCACSESSLKVSIDSGASGGGRSSGGGGLTGSGGVTANSDSGGAVGAGGGSSGASGSGGDDGQGGSAGQSGGTSGSTVASGSGGKSAGTGGGAGASGGSGGTGNLGNGGSGSGAPGGTGGSSTGGSSTGGSGTGGKGTGGGGTRGNGTGGGNPGGNGLGGSGIAGNGPGGTGGSAGSTGASLVTLANSFCAAARSCCARSGLATTLTDCETSFSSRIAAIAFVKQGTETIDNTALAACIAGYNQTATTCAFTPLVNACKGVFVGTKAEGASCGVGGVPMTSGSGECKASGGAELCVWTGDVNVATASGICKTPTRGKNGDPCAISCAINQDCTSDLIASPGTPTTVCFEADGLYCTSSSASVCAPIVAAGGSCATDSSSCASTSYCDSSGATPMCRAAGNLGQVCGTAGTMCLGSLVCGTDNKCDDPGFAFVSTCGGTPPYPY
jgi:hypothetical protein